MAKVALTDEEKVGLQKLFDELYVGAKFVQWISDDKALICIESLEGTDALDGFEDDDYDFEEDDSFSLEDYCMDASSEFDVTVSYGDENEITEDMKKAAAEVTDADEYDIEIITFER